MTTNSIKKETFVYFVGTVMLSILNFVISLLYSKMFSPRDFGTYSLVLGTYTLISQICVGWMTQSIIRNSVNYKAEEQEKKFYGSFFQLHFLMSILFCIGLNVIVSLMDSNLVTKQLYFIFSIIYFFEQYLLITNTILRVRNKSKQYSFNMTLNSTLKIISLILIYYVIGYKSVHVITISLLISEIIQVIYLTFKMELFKYYNIKYFDKTILVKMFKFGFPLVGVAITSWVLNVSDRYIIQYFFTEKEVGLYSYSYNLANSLISLLMQFIMLGAYPNIVKTWESKGKEETIKIIREYLKIYLIIIVPCCFGLLGVGEQFFQLFTDVRYHQSYLNFIITAIGIAVLGLTQYTNKVWELNKKTNIILYFNIFAAILNIILNFIFIPKFGYTFGSVTTLIAYLCYLFLSIVFSRKYLKIEMDKKSALISFIASFLFYIMIMIIRYTNPFNMTINFILEIIISIIIYVFIILKTKVIVVSDILSMLGKKNKTN